MADSGRAAAETTAHGKVEVSRVTGTARAHSNSKM